MKAIECDVFGERDVLVYREVPEPEPGEGEILVKAAYAGVNFTDIYRRQGHYADSPTYPTTLPFRPGVEGSGIVVRTGPGITGIAEGDRIAYCRTNKSYAEYVVVSRSRAIPLSPEIGLDQGAAAFGQGLTAHYLTHSAYALGAGDSCLVHAAAGGVGQFLVQIAKMRGARVFATVGSEEKAAIARDLGADEVILYRETDFRSVVMDKTAGRGVDVVYDSVGKATIQGSLNALRVRGLCVLYGHTSGIVDCVKPLDLSEAGSVFFTRPHMAHYVRTEEEFRSRVGDISSWLASGDIRVTIDRVFPLAEAAAAHAVMEARGSKGKLLLKIDGAL